METQSFQLLDLPLEIRRMIYCCVLFPWDQDQADKRVFHMRRGIEEEPDSLGLRHMWRRHRSILPNRSRAAILRVCRQVHDEATQELYQRPSFRFFDNRNQNRYPMHELYGLDPFPIEMIEFYNFLKVIGARNRRTIRHLHIGVRTEWNLFDITDSVGEYFRYLLGNALELLSQRHSLQTLTIECEEDQQFCELGDILRAPSDYFNIDEEEHELAQKLRMMRGISEVKVTCPLTYRPTWSQGQEDEYQRAKAYIDQYIRHAQSLPSPRQESERGSKQVVESLEELKELEREEEKTLATLRDVRRRKALLLNG